MELSLYCTLLHPSPSSMIMNEPRRDTRFVASVSASFFRITTVSLSEVLLWLTVGLESAVSAWIQTRVSFFGGCFLLCSIFFHRLAILLVICFLAPDSADAMLELLLDLGPTLERFTAPFCSFVSFLRLCVDGELCTVLRAAMSRESTLVDRLYNLLGELGVFTARSELADFPTMFLTKLDDFGGVFCTTGFAIRDGGVFEFWLETVVGILLLGVSSLVKVPWRSNGGVFVLLFGRLFERLLVECFGLLLVDLIGLPVFGVGTEVCFGDDLA